MILDYISTVKHITHIPKEPEATEERRALVKEWSGQKLEALLTQRFDPTLVIKRNCENFIGSVEIPVGIAGPLLLSRNAEQKEYLVPLATTEGALIASVNRGMKVIRESNGCAVISKNEGMTRAPVFKCTNGAVAIELKNWILAHFNEIKHVAESTSSHLELLHVHAWILGRHLYCRFSAHTGDAMGMNMLTIGLQKAIDTVVLPAWKSKTTCVALTSNLCTDKKANDINALLGRGYWAQAETTIPRNIIESVLKTTPERMIEVHVQKNLVGSSLAGSRSQNAHVANIVSALFLATGQDPAHIVEGSLGFTAFELNDDGSLYASVTLPNLNIGVIGGGTSLPAFRDARTLISNTLLPLEFSEVIAGSALAGELSLIASLSTQSLACAHEQLGRISHQK
ncbi:MAG: hypothetical protein A2378_03660 [Candidatus Pacebacteria bacterium RIFOXYB1_FULL_44_10]|nr:MAG: hypothetical protein A2378_03660 [Candidatus Pacebacteria bacterium RIFOXYB1_FULL_44_10]